MPLLPVMQQVSSAPATACCIRHILLQMTLMLSLTLLLPDVLSCRLGSTVHQLNL
jgi:hypothetical protein